MGQYFTEAPRHSRIEQQYSDRRLRSRRERAYGINRRRGEVAEAHEPRGSSDGTAGAALDGAVGRRGNSSWRFVDTRSCRSMIVCMRCRRRPAFDAVLAASPLRAPRDQRLTETEGARPRQAFKAYPLGYIHIDFAEVWTDEGKLYCSSPSIGSASSPLRNYTNGRHDAQRRTSCAGSSRTSVHDHTVLTDNGFQFTAPHGGWTVQSFSSCSPVISAFVPRV